MSTAIFWMVGASLASFFGLLIWTMYRVPLKRTATELMNDFRAMMGGDVSAFPVLIVLKAAEISALKSCHVPLPRRPRERDSGDYSLPVSVAELLDLYRVVMELAQERINRAARRQQACLSGAALALGTLAGHLHSLVLVHCAMPENAIAIPLQSGQATPYTG